MTPDANDLCVFAIKRGIIKNKRFDVYATFSGIINKPQYQYKTLPLASLVDSFSGGTPSKSPEYEQVYWNGAIPWVSPKDFGQFYIVDSEDHITDCAVHDSTTRIAPPNTVLIVVRSGILKHTLPIAITRSDMAINQDIKALCPNDLILSEYLGYYLKVFEKQVLSLCVKHSTTVQSINAAEFFSMEIPIPSITTQKKLCNMMDNADTKRKSLLNNAETLMSSMNIFIHSLLKMHEVPENQSIAFSISLRDVVNTRFDPQYHDPFYTCRIEEIQKMRYDSLDNIITFSTEAWNQHDYFDKVFPYIEISNVSLKQNNYDITYYDISNAPSRAKMIVRNGDIIVSSTRPNRGAIATIQCSPDDIQIASTGFCVLRELKRDDILKEYLQWILLDDYVLSQMLQRSSGGNYPAISTEELKKIVIPIPSIADQQLICKEASARRQQALQLRKEAEQEWADAKARFEKELLGE